MRELVLISITVQSLFSWCFHFGLNILERRMSGSDSELNH